MKTSLPAAFLAAITLGFGLADPAGGETVRDFWANQNGTQTMRTTEKDGDALDKWNGAGVGVQRGGFVEAYGLCYRLDDRPMPGSPGHSFIGTGNRDDFVSAMTAGRNRPGTAGFAAATCCPTTDVQVCGEIQTLTPAVAGETRSILAAMSEIETVVACNGTDWSITSPGSCQVVAGGDCGDAAYAAAHPGECGALPRGCADPAYAATHPAECGAGSVTFEVMIYRCGTRPEDPSCVPPGGGSGLRPTQVGDTIEYWKPASLACGSRLGVTYSGTDSDGGVADLFTAPRNVSATGTAYLTYSDPTHSGSAAWDSMRSFYQDSNPFGFGCAGDGCNRGWAHSPIWVEAKC